MSIIFLVYGITYFIISEIIMPCFDKSELDKSYYVEKLELDDENEDETPLIDENATTRKPNLTINISETPHYLPQSGIN